MKNKRFFGILLTVTLLLCIPLIAMQFSDEVNWTLSDFIIAGALLLGIGLAIEFTARTVKTKSNKIAIIAITLIALFLIWVELAVGIFGTPFAGS